jgi:streptogramin lyase
MDITTHDDFNEFMTDLVARKRAGNEIWCKDSPKSRHLGFLDLTDRVWVRIGLTTLKRWEPTTEQLSIRQLFRTASGRHKLMGMPRMRTETYEDDEGVHTFQVPDEPEWVTV